MLRRLLMQATPPACRLTIDTAGNNIAANIAMIATTTSSSIRVKARRWLTDDIFIR